MQYDLKNLQTCLRFELFSREIGSYSSHHLVTLFRVSDKAVVKGRVLLWSRLLIKHHCSLPLIKIARKYYSDYIGIIGILNNDKHTMFNWSLDSGGYYIAMLQGCSSMQERGCSPCLGNLPDIDAPYHFRLNMWQLLWESQLVLLIYHFLAIQICETILELY